MNQESRLDIVGGELDSGKGVQVRFALRGSGAGSLEILGEARECSSEEMA